ncbi:glycerophosphoryl diester phosphodiesterase [Vibrio anguillarum]|uniref:glycerophosphoryl diester phosphodiesterase n=1 Tax=Vibrio anguillarum TaxID=55601 RepID=UPI000B5461BF|nr:glycerophosphoryl diester phosphodiesterase [Vibrio anguillarum]ASG07398.1 glycerophosphoryl diester phosphodiesterase [Vibrio anguillarum]
MKPMIIGHRGVAGHYPENTQVSVQAAIDLGLKWVEVDVQPTQDHILVVCHDHTIDRCSNGKGRIDSYTLEQLQQFDFGGWFDPQFAGEPIMTLETLLTLAKQHSLGLNIEVKMDKHDVAQVAAQLKAQLDQCGLPNEQIVLSSFSHAIMRELYQHCPGYKLAVLSERLTRKDKQVLAEIDAFGCNLNYQWISAKHIAELHQAGYQIWCYTVNNPKKFKHLNSVDAIFSDDPQCFL